MSSNPRRFASPGLSHLDLRQQISSGKDQRLSLQNGESGEWAMGRSMDNDG